MLQRLEMKTRPLAPALVRYTCLGQVFKIEKETTCKFMHENKTYTERLWVLPHRKDQVILLGRDWLRRTCLKPQKDDVALEMKEEKLEDLIEKLYEGRQEGITLDYECPIEIN